MDTAKGRIQPPREPYKVQDTMDFDQIKVWVGGLDSWDPLMEGIEILKRYFLLVGDFDMLKNIL